MSGTTLCPNCNTRFKIAREQLEAHHGMVRCGHCLQAFDAYPGYIPDQPHPQLELPMLDEHFARTQKLPVYPPKEDEAGSLHEPDAIAETRMPENTEPVIKTAFVEERVEEQTVTIPQADEALPKPEHPHEDIALPEPEALPPPVLPVTQHMTLAEQVVIVHDEEDIAPASRYCKWPWAIAVLLLSSVLFAQAAYFFRVDLAARLPGLKPALIGYCHLLGCSVPLPQKSGLMSIESSDLEADVTHENRITLNVLLRNRAPYTQAFPNLELTLNDTQDKPIARRILKPADYLPSSESEKNGLPSNHELSAKLYLNITELRPTGYRLMLFYP